MVFRYHRESVPSQNVFHRTISFSNTPVRSKNDSKLKLSSNIRSSIKTPSSTLYIFIPNDATSLSQGFETFWTQNVIERVTRTDVVFEKLCLNVSREFEPTVSPTQQFQTLFYSKVYWQSWYHSECFSKLILFGV